MTLDRYEQRDPQHEWRDFHAVSTITLGELVEGGWVDWSDSAWAWNAYDEEQRSRIQNMIVARFWTREISMLPPRVWRMAFIERLNELMRVASLMYRLREKLDEDVSLDFDEWHKSRDVFSDFPATLLNGSSQDYASTGTDREYETERDMAPLEAARMLSEYRDPDIYVLDGLESMFSSLVSVSVDGF